MNARHAFALVAAAMVGMLFGAPRAALAHELRAAEIVIEARSATVAAVNVRAPGRAAITLAAPSGCTFDVPPSPAGMLRCPSGIAGAEVDVRGVGNGVEIVWVQLTGFGGDGASEATVVTARSPHITLPGSAARGDVALRYLRFGAEHVLSGFDHVLFMIALFWQAWAAGRGSLRRTAAELARTATAFTVAHSLTLVATVLGLVRVAPALSEAFIAFTLFLVALDIGRDGAQNESANDRRLGRVALAGVFGLVHGLGFAGALTDTKLPDGGRWTAIATFNAGVEAGQILVFASCLLAIAMVRATLERWRATERLAVASAWVVGCAGSTLFFLRISSLVHG